MTMPKNSQVLQRPMKPLTLLLLGLLLASPVTAGELKPTMKEMRLHYKQAIDATAPEQFNQRVKLFLTELQVARNFDFSSERAKLSLEGWIKSMQKSARCLQQPKLTLLY